METQDEKARKIPISSIIIAQCICMGIILLTVLVTKYFSPKCFTEIKGLYDKYLCSETTINEVLETDGDIYEI